MCSNLSLACVRLCLCDCLFVLLVVFVCMLSFLLVCSINRLLACLLVRSFVRSLVSLIDWLLMLLVSVCLCLRAELFGFCCLAGFVLVGDYVWSLVCLLVCACG